MMTHIELYNVVAGFTLKSELEVYCQSVTSARSVLTAARKKNLPVKLTTLTERQGMVFLKVNLNI